jgi:hypothetical protein
LLRVKRSEFIQYTSKYLKLLPIIITNRGKDELVLQKIPEPPKTHLTVFTINVRTTPPDTLPQTTT